MAAGQNKGHSYRPLSGNYYKSFRKYVVPFSAITGVFIYSLYGLLGTHSLFISVPILIGSIFYMLLEVVRQSSLIAANNYQNGIQQAQSIQAIYSILEPDLPLPSMARWAGNPDLCQLIMKQILTTSPGVVFEVGSGVSTLVAGLTLKKTGGTMISIDHEDRYLVETEREISQHGLSQIARTCHCPLMPVNVDNETYQWYDLSLLDEIPGIDLLIIDGPPTRIQRHSRYPALPLLYDKLSENAVIVLDDGRRKDEQEVAQRWTDKYALVSRFMETEKGVFIFSRTGHH